MNNLKVCFALGFFMLLSSGASQSAATAVPIAHLQVMASVGPQAYLYNAKVTVNDAKGNLIIKGRTNIRGSVMFYLPESKLHYQPLKFTTTGGKIIGQTGDQFNGPAFGGHLKGEIDDVLLNKHVIAYLDLHSTIASVLSYRMTSYPYEYQLVRDAFSIGKGFPVWGIRYQNNHVSWLLLLQKIRKNHGYDNYVKSLAHKIRTGKKITELTPSRYASNYQPQTSPRIAQATASSTSTYPQCNIPVGNGSLSSSSASVSLNTIENFGVASLNLLMANYGYASGQFGFVDNIVGMVFSGLGGDDAPSPTTVALQDVDAQLACINSQLSYLSEETTELLTLVEEEQFTTDILAANNCATSVAGNFSLYTGTINSALPYSSSLTGQTPLCYTSSPGVITAGTASTCPISNSTGDLADWSPTAPMAGYCGVGGNVINDMLLGTEVMPSAWIQLNLIYQTKYAWYTQAQVQQLQQFISFWSTIEYQYFALTNEYYNATPGGAELAGISAGNANIGDATQCTSGTTPSTASFCAAQSNLLYAFPPSIYSDEIAVWQTSIAVNPYPAGLAIPNIGTQTGLNALWVQDFVDWSDTNDTQYIGMGVFAVQPSYTAFNLQAVNPSIYPSGVTAPTTIEQFSYPQALRTIMPTSTQLASLQSPQTQDGGQTSLAFFSNALDQIPPTLTVTGTGYQLCGLSGYLNPNYICTQNISASFPIAGAWGAGSAENGVGYFANDSETSFMITGDNIDKCGTNEFNHYSCQTLYYTLINSPVPFDGFSPDNLKAPATSWPSSDYNPIYGALLGRGWWAQSQVASTSFNPPTPPQ